MTRFHHQRQRLARAEQLHVAAERDHGESVHRCAEHSALSLADADDAEVHALDLDGVIERIDFAEQLVGDVPAKQHHRGLRSTSTALIIRPRSASKDAKSRYSGVTPWIWMLSSTWSR